jgi:hypothetical protein
MNKLNSALLNLTTLALLALATVTPSTVYADGGAVDTMTLADEPGIGLLTPAQKDPGDHH